jgi:hypothetical protein
VPTFAKLRRFVRDYEQLTADQQRRFLDAVNQFVGDLREGVGFHPRLRVKRVQGTPDVWEMTWAPDGRATFSYGDEIIDGEPHIIWRRVGTHDIFRRP